MIGDFEGWPKGAFEVLLELDGEPSAEVRRRCRRDREELVRRPMIELLNAVADTDSAYKDFSVWSYGDVLLGAWQRQTAIAVAEAPVSRRVPAARLTTGFTHRPQPIRWSLLSPSYARCRAGWSRTCRGPEVSPGGGVAEP